MTRVLDLRSVKDTSLWNRLHDGFKGKPEAAVAESLAANLGQICDEAGDRMKRMPALHGQYTLHDDVHLLRVTELMARIMPDEVIARLSPVELALLILAAHMHDQGMVLDAAELTALESDPDFTLFRDNWTLDHSNLPQVRDQLRDHNLAESKRQQYRQVERELLDAMLTDFVRRTHGGRSAKFVLDKYGNDERLRVSGRNIGDLIARLCRSHVESAEMLTPSNGFLHDEHVGDFRINMPYLAAILRLADILDLDRDRTPDALYRAIHFTNPVSLAEWAKHRSVEGWAIDEKRICFTMECEHPQYQRTALQFMDWIDDELIGTKAIIDAFPAPVATYTLNLPLRVDRGRITPEGGAYRYHDLEFSLSRDEVVKLFMADELYRSPSLCIRELLQNALDALRHRQALIKRDLGTDWQDGKVEFEHTLDEHGHEVVRCIDNGAGMDEEIVTRFLTNAGRSYYRSPEFERERATFSTAGCDFDPCARFGIGFMSCFMLGDRITIRTRRDRGPKLGLSDPLIIEISGLGGIVVIRQGDPESQGEPGTTVEITGRKKPLLIDEWDDIVRLIHVIRGYALACEFPIEARCQIEDIRDNVRVEPTIALRPTAIEEAGVSSSLTLHEPLESIHPLLRGGVKASFLVDKVGHLTIENEEAKWGFDQQGHLALLTPTGKTVFEHAFHGPTQICCDGILVCGDPGRDERELLVDSFGGSSIGTGNDVLLLDARGSTKPRLTPARTPPSSGGTRDDFTWCRLGRLVRRAHGRVWEQVARSVAESGDPELLWVLAAIHRVELDILPSGCVWALVQIPVVSRHSGCKWRRLETIGPLRAVRKKDKEGLKYATLRGPRGTRVGLSRRLSKYRGKQSPRERTWPIERLTILMSELRLADDKPAFVPKRPTDMSVVLADLAFGDRHFDEVVVIPYGEDIRRCLSASCAVRTVNRSHPVVEAVRRSETTEPALRTPLQHFCTATCSLLSIDPILQKLDKPDPDTARWMQRLGAQFHQINWESVDPALAPPYQVWIDGTGIREITPKDLTRWAEWRP